MKYETAEIALTVPSPTLYPFAVQGLSQRGCVGDMDCAHVHESHRGENSRDGNGMIKLMLGISIDID